MLKAWLLRFESLAPATLTPLQRMDREILLAQIRSDLWQLDELREWAWNPAAHNPASALDKILHTDWAPMHRGASTRCSSARQLPAYYQAARQSLADVTREHTRARVAATARRALGAGGGRIRRAAGGAGRHHPAHLERRTRRR